MELIFSFYEKVNLKERLVYMIKIIKEEIEIEESL